MRYSVGHRSQSRLPVLVMLCLIAATFCPGQNQGGDRWFSITFGSQNEKDRWQRVATENGFVSDVDSQSLAIGKDGSITARFRMKFAKAERLGSSVMYRTREDTIQFDRGKDRYQVVESNYLDGSGKVVASSSVADWKPIRSGYGSEMYYAAARLRPFGEWSVLSYRYASGEPASADDPPDLRSLIKSSVLLRPDRFIAGKKTCDSPVLEAGTITNEESIKRIGSPLKAIGIMSDKINVLFVNCETNNAFPLNTIMLQISDGKIVMLWEGVFLELEMSQ